MNWKEWYKANAEHRKEYMRLYNLDPKLAKAYSNRLKRARKECEKQMLKELITIKDRVSKDIAGGWENEGS